ncbi:MAG: hypothetical protein ABL961_13550 [Vicinamibacterales bacterium]
MTTHTQTLRHFPFVVGMIATTCVKVAREGVADAVWDGALEVEHVAVTAGLALQEPTR